MPGLDSVIGPIARTGINLVSRGRLPKTQGTLNLPGLQEQVEILRDEWGIPHIFARNNHDLFFAQGFVHAQDRLWQMELNRRMARGKLSEVLGELALDTDRTARTFGFDRLGQVDLANSSQEVCLIIQAYTEGVNGFLKQPGVKLPVEFTLLRYHPQPWQVEDSAAWMRVMIWELSHAWYGEVVRAQIVQKVGPERAAELEVQYPAQNPTTLPSGIDFNCLDADGMLKMVKGPFLDQGKGSNAWAIAGNKSATGMPFLCNDMHLAMGLPSIWYEAHLVGGDYNVIGVTLPGAPLVLVGHNDFLAWGMTLAFTDCEDVYVEQFDPENPTRYQFQGGWEDAKVIEEPIPVKGRTQPYVEKVIVTRHGPIVSDVIGYADQRVAVQSMSLRPCQAFDGFTQLDHARSWDDFVEALRQIEAPQLNVAYADVEGNIGYWVTGKVPLRAKGDGSIPAPGWSGEYEWVGEVPFEEMPHAFNPQQGYVVTCNHRIVTDDYPYFLGNVWMNGYRARRIVDYFENKEKLSAKDMQVIHVDFTCIPGIEFVGLLGDMTSTDPDVNLALERLRAWDGRLTPDSVGGSLYEVTRYTLVRELVEPVLGKDLMYRWMGKGFHPLLFHSSEFYGHDTTAVFRFLRDPDSWWVQKAGGCQEVLTRSLKQSVEWLRGELGPNPEEWKWGRLHRITFAHALGLQKPLDLVFNRGPYPIGGDTDTPCQTAMYADDPFDNKAWAPSVRFIMDMGDLSRSVAMFAPGQSGQLGSPHYDDLIQSWLTGEYHPMCWTREQIEKNLEGLLTLNPGA